MLAGVPMKLLEALRAKIGWLSALIICRRYCRLKRSVILKVLKTLKSTVSIRSPDSVLRDNVPNGVPNLAAEPGPLMMNRTSLGLIGVKARAVLIKSDIR